MTSQSRFSSHFGRQRLSDKREQLSNQKRNQNRMPVGLVLLRGGATLGCAGAAGADAASATDAAGAGVARAATKGAAAGRR